MNPYEILGLTSSASTDEVKRAYRKLARQYHPDLHPGDEAASKKMNEINEAYDRIMNPSKYAAEDARRARADAQQQYTNAARHNTGYGTYSGAGQNGHYG